MMTTHTTAIQPTTALHRPRFHGPGTKFRSRRRRNTGVTYAMYRPMTAIEVTARYAVRFHIAGTVSTIDSATQSQIEFVGVPVRGFTFAHTREPGIALSRENA